MTGEVARWADMHQYRREPMPQGAGGPRVYLLNATPDPLGSLAALVATYEGRIVRSLGEVTHEERKAAYVQMTNTALNSALECMQFHFLFEGVDRSFTHQQVRGRHAFYAQESLRFAVAEDWAAEVPLPLSLSADPDSAKARIWQRTLNQIEDAYGALVHDGMPAEEARGLLPHAIPTRIHWVVTWRELLHVAGLRTCTQAQFVWRVVFAQVAQALRQYGDARPKWPALVLQPAYEGQTATVSDGWQYRYLADQLRPVCYQTGRCQFRADFDRSCSIRDRVEANYAAGREPAVWDQPHAPCHDGIVKWALAGNIPTMGVQHNGHTDDVLINPIRPEEWAADPSAARKTGGVNTKPFVCRHGDSAHWPNDNAERPVHEDGTVCGPDA